MASNAKKQHKKLRYFYLPTPEGLRLHKALSINTGADQIVTWCYSLGKRVVYTYSDVRKRKQPAYRTAEVTKFLNRGRVTLERMILNGDIEPPEFVYTIDEHRRKYMYMWSEDDIVNAHSYLLTVHKGRPRDDGGITPHKMPNIRELRAMIRQEEILYVKNADGGFVPTWQAQDF